MFVFICIVVLVSIDFGSVAATNLTTESPPTQNKNRSRDVSALMLVNGSFYGDQTNPKEACRWFRGFKYQRNQCSKRRGLPRVLVKARQLAIKNCQDQFKYDGWNCALKKSTFKKIYRETAFLYSLTAAALLYTAAQACSGGELQNCYCAKEKNKTKGANWKWGGCGDNTNQAKKLTNKFLRVQLKGSKEIKGLDRVYRHNTKMGMRVVTKGTIKVCMCHGVSASCTMKTCWKRLIPFNKISANLKNKYHTAVRLTSMSKLDKQLKKFSSNLVYVTSSTEFCDTAGRRCNDPDHCATLCCSRGHNESTEIVENKCRCRWNQQTFTVNCDICRENVDIYTCK